MPHASLITQNVSYIAANGHVHRLSSAIGTGATKWSHTDLTAVAIPDHPIEAFGLTSYVDPNFQHVGYLTTDGHVWELTAPFASTSAPSWRSLDLTKETSAPTPYVDSALTGWEDQNWMFVVYQTSDGHLHALIGLIDQPLIFWFRTDLMLAVPGVPLAGLKTPVASWADLTWWHVVYLDGQGALHHLFSGIGGTTWAIDDFIPGPGPQMPDVVSRLTSWWDSSSSHVGFLRVGHVLELAESSVVGRWTLTDLTKAASGAPESLGPSLTSCVDQDDQHVIYVDINGYLHELSAPIGTQSWKHTPITAIATGAPAVPIVTNELGNAVNSALTSWADPELRHVVYETDDGNLHQVFAPSGSAAWEYSAITANATGAPPARQFSPLTSWTQPLAPANLSVTVQPRPFLAAANYTFSVTDAASGSPVPDALITIYNGPKGGGPSKLTGTNGKAEFLDLRLENINLGVAGRHPITMPPSFAVKATGFNAFKKDFW